MAVHQNRKKHSIFWEVHTPYLSSSEEPKKSQQHLDYPPLANALPLDDWHQVFLEMYILRRFASHNLYVIGYILGLIEHEEKDGSHRSFIYLLSNRTVFILNTNHVYIF